MNYEEAGRTVKDYINNSIPTMIDVGLTEGKSLLVGSRISLPCSQMKVRSAFIILLTELTKHNALDDDVRSYLQWGYILLDGFFEPQQVEEIIALRNVLYDQDNEHGLEYFIRFSELTGGLMNFQKAIELEEYVNDVSNEPQEEVESNVTNMTVEDLNKIYERLKDHIENKNAFTKKENMVK